MGKGTSAAEAEFGPAHYGTAEAMPLTELTGPDYMPGYKTEIQWLMTRFLISFVRWLVLPTFFQAGFTYEKSDHLEGWLSRDGYTGDWILWSPFTKQMYRRKDQDGARWEPSLESKGDCLKLGQVYAERVGMKL